MGRHYALGMIFSHLVYPKENSWKFKCSIILRVLLEFHSLKKATISRKTDLKFVSLNDMKFANE